MESGKTGVEVVIKILKESKNLSGGTFISEILSEGNKGFDEMGILVHTVKFLGDLLKMTLGFLDLDKRSIWVHETFNKLDALINGFNSKVMFFNFRFIV